MDGAWDAKVTDAKVGQYSLSGDEAKGELVVSGMYGRFRHVDKGRDGMLKGVAETDGTTVAVRPKDFRPSGSGITVTCEVVTHKQLNTTLTYPVCAWADDNTAAVVAEVTAKTITQSPSDVDLEAAAKTTLQVRSETREGDPLTPPLDRAPQTVRHSQRHRLRPPRRERRPQGEGVRRRAVRPQVQQAGLRLGDRGAVAGRDPPQGHHRLLHPLEPLPAAGQHLAVTALVHVRRQRVRVAPDRHVDDQPVVAEDGHVRRVAGLVLQPPHETVGGVGVGVHGVEGVDEVLQLRRSPAGL